MTRTTPGRIKPLRAAVPVLLLWTALTGAGLFGAARPASAQTEETYPNLEIFANILSLLQQNYVEEVDTRQVVEGAIKGMLATLDPHSSYLKPDHFKDLQVETTGRFSGIGIEITQRDNVLTVVSPIEGTPAYKKGLEAGDMILKIDGESTQDMSLTEAVNKLRGPKGSEVVISILRQGWTALKDVAIVRDVIPLLSIRAKLLEPDYGYVRITNFQAKTTADLKKALADLTADRDLQGLVLDLRNNPGGLLDQSFQVADLFIDDGVIVSTRGRMADQNVEYQAHPGGPDYSFPMVVLVNEGTASASEIVAGALQDHKRALILGTRTFGKGSVQTIIPLPDGAGLRMTTARYYTPNGTSIQAKGITPDVTVASRPAEPAGETKQQTKPHFLREKDLLRHFENEEEVENGLQEKNGAPEENVPEENMPEDNVPEGNVPGENGAGETSPTEGGEVMEERNGEEASGLETVTEEHLEADRQLHTALIVLKSLNILTGNAD